MRVIHILPHSLEPFVKLNKKEDWENAEHHVINLVSDLVKQDEMIEHELWMLSSVHRTQFEVQHQGGFKIKIFPRDIAIFLPLETSFRLLCELYKKLKTRDTIWHLHSYYLFMFNPEALLIKARGGSFFAHHRGGGFTLRSLPYGLFHYYICLPITLRLSAGIFVQNTREANRLKRYYLIQKRKIILVPNYAPTQYPSQTKSVCETDCVTLSYLGRIIGYKGIPQIISICRKLIGNGINLKLRLIGEGDLVQSIKKKNYQWIELVGQKNNNEALKILSESDVFLFGTTKKEGSPKALIEAQLLGLPAIGFYCEGVEDVIKNGETGFLVKNWAQFQDKVELLIKNRGLRYKLSKQASRIINAKFEKKLILDRILENYYSLK